jgi:hypothetical protein
VRQNHSAQIKRERNNERTAHLVFVTKPKANINIFAKRKVSIDSTIERLFHLFSVSLTINNNPSIGNIFQMKQNSCSAHSLPMKVYHHRIR